MDYLYKDIRIISVTPDGTAYKTLKELVDTVLAGKSQTLPNADILKVILTPATALIVQDAFTGDDSSISVRTEYELFQPLEKLKLKNAVVTKVELYFGRYK